MNTANPTEESVEELCESIVINTLNGGALRGLVFRHEESSQNAKTERVTVKADAPEPRLGGEGGFRVNVNVEMRSPKGRTARFHREAMERLLTVSFMRSAALAAGLTTADNLTILNEEIGGDRSNTSNLRKRTIVIPLIIAFGA